MVSPMMDRGDSAAPSMNLCSAAGFILRQVHVRTQRCRAAKRRQILENINLIVRPRRLTAIIGKFGSGKTTLLTLLSGRLDPGKIQDGEFLVIEEEEDNVTDCSSPSTPPTPINPAITEIDDPKKRPCTVSYKSVSSYEKMTKNAIRYVAQSPATFENLTARNILQFATSLRNGTTRGSSYASDYYLDTCYLSRVQDVKAHPSSERTGLSAGELRRLDVARELAVSGQGKLACLIMDEPTTSLDAAIGLELLGMIKTMVQSSVIGTVVASLQQPTPSALRLFDDLICLHEGRIMYCGPVTRAVDTIFGIRSLLCTVGSMAAPSAEVDHIDIADSVLLLMPDEDESEVKAFSEAFYNSEIGKEQNEKSNLIGEREEQQQQQLIHSKNQAVEIVDSKHVQNTRSIWSDMKHVVSRTLWEVRILTEVIFRSLIMRRASFGLPLMLIFLGATLGFLFRGSAHRMNLPSNLINLDILRSPVVDYLEHLVQEPNGVVGEFFQKQIDPLSFVIDRPELVGWVYNTSRCVHQSLGLNYPDRARIPDNLKLKKPMMPSYYLLAKEDPRVIQKWLNDTDESFVDRLKVRWSEIVPTVPPPINEEAVERPMLDSELKWDHKFEQMTPRMLMTAVTTTTEIAKYIFDNEDIRNQLKTCTSSEFLESLSLTPHNGLNISKYYSCFLVSPISHILEVVGDCGGIPTVFGEVGNLMTTTLEPILLSIFGSKTGDVIPDVRNRTLKARIDQRHNRKSTETHGGYYKVQKNKINIEQQHSVKDNVQTGHFGNNNHRKLFFRYDENKDALFVFLKQLTNFIGLPVVYKLFIEATETTSNAMSIGAVCFFSVAAAGFFAFYMIGYWFTYRVVINRDVLNKTYYRHSSYLAYNLATLPFQVAMSFLVFVPLFAIAELPLTFTLLLITALGTVALSALQMIVCTASPNFQAGLRIAPVVFVLSVIFSSFFVRGSDTRVWMRGWLPYLSPYKWSVTGCVITILQSNDYHGRLPLDIQLAINGIATRTIATCIGNLIAQVILFHSIAIIIFHFAYVRTGTV